MQQSSDQQDKAYAAWIFRGRGLQYARRVSGLTALTLAACLICLYFFRLAARALYGFAPGEVLNELLTTALYVTAFFLPFLLLFRALRFTADRIPHGPPAPSVTLACMGLLLGLVLIGSWITNIVNSYLSPFFYRGGGEAQALPQTPVGIALYVINVVVLPAFIEEFAFRGVLLAALRPFGDKFAILVSALLFGLMHRNMVQFPYAFILGAGLGYFFVQTGTIWTGVAGHALNNLLAVLLAFYQGTGPEMDVGFLLVQSGAQAGLYLAAALAALFYLIFIRKAPFSLPPGGRCPLRPGELCRHYFLNLPMLAVLTALCALIFRSLSGQYW